MSYIYKGTELPEFKDPNWHLILDPFFRDIIDQLSLDAYSVNRCVEVSNIVYAGKETEDDKWLIKKVDNTGANPVITWATITNNPTFSTLDLAWATYATLTYGSDITLLLT